MANWARTSRGKSAALIETIRHYHTPVSEVKDEASGKTWAITLYHINEFGSAGTRDPHRAGHHQARRVEALLRQSEMMSLLGSLVAGVAHEVRNPLFGISSILDAFETRFSDRTEYQRYTNVLRDEIGRLTVLMEELLEYGNRFAAICTSFQWKRWSRVPCARVPASEVAKVQLNSDVEDALPKIKIDRRRLSKVFVNLIENAIQHSPSGTTCR